VGRPSRVGAESDVIAIVELHSGSTRHGLRGLCVDLLNPHEVPRKIVIVSSIPTTRDGKLDRSALPSLLR
jgi:acyl-coenzyme A synthetase/AMP-(fatty) acid ligase